jgi:hypothetical protein
MPVPLLFSLHCCTAVSHISYKTFFSTGFQRCHAESPSCFFSSRLWASATLNGINLVEVAERAAVRMCEPAFLEASPQGMLEMCKRW